MKMFSEEISQADLVAPQLPKQHHDPTFSAGVETIGEEKIAQTGEARQAVAGEVNVENSPLLKWNDPRMNVWRTLTAFLGFFIMGANDAAFGALIPYLETYYNISYLVVSLIFISPLVGYFASALLNNRIHMLLGRRGVAFLAPGTRLIAYLVTTQHPTYPVLVLVFILAGFSNGLEDGAWNAWLGVMQNANEILGFLHAFYGLGALLSPLIATSMITKGNLGWYAFYYLMFGLTLLEFILAVPAFWAETGKEYRAFIIKTRGGNRGSTRDAIRNRVTWICSIFLLIYVGVEVAVGGWVVVFMQKVRNAAPFPAGMSATGYWLGITVGRGLLGFVTPRIGEELATLIYISLATISHLLFWLIPSFPSSATFVAILGFFLGPLFPAAVIAAARRLPSHLHVSSIGFAIAFGASGACVFPFAVGAIAQARGFWVLMPVVLGMLVLDGLVWLTLPKTDGDGMKWRWPRRWFSCGSKFN